MDSEDSDALLLSQMEEDIVMTPPRECQSDGQLSTEVTRPFHCKTCQTQSAVPELKRYLKNFDNAAFLPISSTVEIFNHVFGPHQMLTDNRQQLFMFLRQWMNAFESRDVETESRHREDIVKFLDFVKHYISSLPAFTRDDVICEVVKELQGIVIYCDPPSQILNNASLVNDYATDKFHASLDILVGVLKILHLIEVKFPDCPVCVNMVRCVTDTEMNYSRSAFDQILDFIVWELMTMAKNKYKQASYRELMTTSPFACPCVSEVWCILKVMVDHRHQANKGQTFMDVMCTVIRTLSSGIQEEDLDTEVMDTDVYDYPPKACFHGDSSGFCLWILVHISKFSHITNQEFWQQISETVITILKSCLTQDDVKESKVRFVVALCQEMSVEVKSQILMQLWEFFYKKLNSSFFLDNKNQDVLSRFSDRSSQKKNAGCHLELCQRLSQGQSKADDNSFLRFLSLLCGTLREKGIYSGEWKQMKGRVYSKFHIRRMQELTETGMQNFFTLFVSLAVTGDHEDMVNKMCKFSDMISSTEDTGIKLSQMTGLFAAVLFFIQKKIDVSLVAQKIVQQFQTGVDKFSHEECRRYQSWRVICCFLEHVTEVFERSTDIEFSQHVFLSEGFGKLIKVCRSTEISTVLTVLQEILTKFRSIVMRNHLMTPANKAMLTAAVTHIYPSLKSLCCSLTSTQQCADLLAAMFLVSVECDEESHVGMLKFSISDQINKSVCSRFFSQILSVDSCISKLTDHQSSLIQTWISCAILVPQSPFSLKNVYQFSDIQEIFIASGVTPSLDGSSDIFQFIQAIKQAYNNTQGWKERTCLRDKVMQYFMNIHRQISPVVQALQPADVLKNMFVVIGYLVKNCAPLLFIQSKPDCPLPNILSTLIIPHSMFNTEKPPKSAFVSIVGEHLHQFMIGLSRLDYRRATYVNRRIGDIISIYLPKYWSSSLGPSRQHPLVVWVHIQHQWMSIIGQIAQCANLSRSLKHLYAVFPLPGKTYRLYKLSLKESFTIQPSEAAVKFRSFMLELICEKFLKSGNLTLNANHQYAVKFYLEVSKATIKTQVKEGDCSILLYQILKVNLLNPTPQSELILQHLMEAAHQSHLTSDISHVCGILGQFVKDHKKTHLDATLTTLQKMPPKCAMYVKEISPELQHYVIENESFRGVGRDSKIRLKYLQMLKHFGIET